MTITGGFGDTSAGGGFPDAFAGNQGTMLLNALKSLNFVAGVSGWQIQRNGNAEFNNLTIRGTFFGTNFIISSTGAYFYSGAPALGNLSASITSLPGADSFGNTTLTGFTTYFPGNIGLGLPWQAVSMNGANVNYQTSATPNGVYTQQITQNFSASPGIFLYNVSAGVNAQINLRSDGFVQLVCSSTIDINSVGGNITFEALQLVTNGNPFDLMSFLSSGGTSYNVSGAAQASNNVNTVNGTALANLTQTTVPASDAVAGSVYKLHAFGQGTWGNPVTNLTFEITLGGTPIGLVAVAGAAFPVGVTFDWSAEATLSCIAPGGGATWNGDLKVLITQQTNAATGLAAANNSLGLDGNNGTSPIPKSSIISNIFQLGAFWGAGGTGATISKITGWAEKINH